MLRRSGLRILHEQSYDDTPAFQHDVLAASRPRGGTVLAARVEATDATRSCETFFDLPHDGTCAKRIARFPSRDELLAPLADAKLRRPWLGLICGPSGSSKSAILAVHFGASALRHWERGTPLADAFKSAEQRDRCMRAAALLRRRWRASDCSAGQLAQVRLALTLASAESAAGGSGGATADEGGDGIALFDEFGSAWDETTAAPSQPPSRVRSVSSAAVESFSRGATHHASVLGRSRPIGFSRRPPRRAYGSMLHSNKAL